MVLPQNIETTGNKPKYLVVDDLIAPNKTYKKRFVANLRVPTENVIFASSYEEATKQIKSVSNIVCCFVDCIIPKLEKSSNLLEERFKQYQKQGDTFTINNIKEAEWGIKIIAENQGLKMFPFSAHLDDRDLKELADKYSNVIGTAQKPLKSEKLDKVRQEYIEPFFPKTQADKPSRNLLLLDEESFDYSSLDEDLSSFVQEKTQKIKKLIKKTTEDIINIGTYLTEVKEKLGHGNYLNWLYSEFKWSNATASRFMNVAAKFKSISLQDLDILPTALYELAAPSAPEEATFEAIERAKRGETITAQKVKDIKAKYKPRKKNNRKNTETVSPSTNIITDPAINKTENDSTKQQDLAELSSFKTSSTPKNIEPIKQEVLTVIPTDKAFTNSWWQFGGEHKLFCGEPSSKQFLDKLPKNIRFTMFLPPSNDLSLISLTKSQSNFYYFSPGTDFSIHHFMAMIENCLFVSTDYNNVVVMNYVYNLEVVEKANGLGCVIWLAEPDLDKCDLLLNRWREKEPGTVRRLKY